MKINSLSLISVVSVLTCASTANAAVLADFYIGGMAGVGGQTTSAEGKHKTESSRVYGGIVGMDLPIFRVEGEYNYFDSSDLDTNAAMLNVYAKIPSVFVLPYLGAGMGVVFGGKQTFTEDGVKKEYSINSTSAYQAMLGATIDIFSLPIKFDVEGRILYAPDIYKIETATTTTTPDMLQYGVRAKMRYIF